MFDIEILVDSEPFTIKLFDNNYIEDILYDSNNIVVYNDKAYSLKLIATEDDSIEFIKKIKFYINNQEENVFIYSDGTLLFENKYIFYDCYSTVQINIELLFKDNSKIILYSPYMAVYINDDNMAKNIKDMVGYINQYSYFSLEHMDYNNKISAGLKEGGYKTFETYIKIASRIIMYYENNYSYFKINCRKKIIKENIVTPIHRIQNINEQSLHYIARHFEQLSPTNYDTGIKVDNKNYFPQYISTESMFYSIDIYENQVIISFLSKVLYDIDLLIKDIDNQFIAVAHQSFLSEKDNKYVSISFHLLQSTKTQLKKYMETLSSIKLKIQELYFMYKEIFKINEIVLSHIPKPTDIFMSIPNYNQIYTVILEWFRFGAFDLEKNMYLFSFAGQSKIYEYYILSKLLTSFIERGYVLKEQKYYEYFKIKDRQVIDNIYILEGVNKEITVYYEPTISSDYENFNTGPVELYRNNSASLHGKSGAYYFPDYVIKVYDKHKKTSKFIVCDAKFTKYENAQYKYAPELIFKYLVSLSTFSEKDSIAGLVTFYGKCENDDIQQSFYDKMINYDNLAQFVDVIPADESNNHFILTPNIINTL